MAMGVAGTIINSYYLCVIPSFPTFRTSKELPNHTFLASLQLHPPPSRLSAAQTPTFHIEARPNNSGSTWGSSPNVPGHS